MNYSQSLAWLYATQLHGIKLGLDNTRRLMAALEIGPGRFLHVAGTNGKGSVCAMLDSICRAAGIRTGLFTSPHLVSFRERIRINGGMISEKEVAAGLTRMRDLISHWDRQPGNDGASHPHPTFFEITTALALDHFQRHNAELVVLETGMGGRLDATNAILPLVSVITTIDLDHQQWLGSTLTEIATEKAGIIKPGVPAVSSPQGAEAAAVLRKTAAERDTAITFIDTPVEEIEIGLDGSHQRMNAAVAVTALRKAGLALPEEAIHAGLRNVQWPGRFQRIGDRFVVDGSHNPSAAERLTETWHEFFGDAKATIIVGILCDKDVAGICRALAPIAARVYAVPVASPRSSAPEDLARAFHHSSGIACEAVTSLERAFTLARAHREPILITGSLFLAGEALSMLNPEPVSFEPSAQ